MAYDPNAAYMGGEPPDRTEIIYFTPEEIADNLRVTRRTVYRWIKEGTLRGVKAGVQWRIPETEIASMLNNEGYCFNPTSWRREDGKIKFDPYP